MSKTSGNTKKLLDAVAEGYYSFGLLRLIGGIGKGHPDENEVKSAVEFFRRIMDKL